MHALPLKTVALVVLAGFISFSLFGFLGMLATSPDAHAPTKCLASLAQNGVCPPESNTIASAIFHTNAMKAFTTALLADVAALIAVVFFLALFLEPLLHIARLAAATLVQRITELVSHWRAIRELRLSLVRLEHSPTSL